MAPVILDLKDVRRTYQMGEEKVRALAGVSLQIRRGEYVAIMKVSLVDTVHKKTAFLTQVKAQLGLANVTVYTMKVQELAVADCCGAGAGLLQAPSSSAMAMVAASCRTGRRLDGERVMSRGSVGWENLRSVGPGRGGGE